MLRLVWVLLAKLICLHIVPLLQLVYLVDIHQEFLVVYHLDNLQVIRRLDPVVNLLIAHRGDQLHYLAESPLDNRQVIQVVNQ